MINPTRLRVVALANILLLTIATAAGASRSPVDRPFHLVAVDRFITTQMARHRIPGLAVAITYGEQVVFVCGYGEAQEGVPVLTFPEIKNGLIEVLLGHAPVTGPITLPWLGRGLAALSAVIVGLAIWSLLRLPRWKAWAVNASRLKLGWGLLWPLAPALLLLALPRLLVLQSGRYFEPVRLLRAMPELMILLGVCGALGLLNSVVRFAAVLRTSGQRRSTGTSP